MSDVNAQLKLGLSFEEFLRTFMLKEKIPKEFRQRSDYVYIYVRNYLVDRVCFYNKKGKNLRRFCKNTEYKEENNRVWITPKNQYTLMLGDNSLQENKIYFIQVKPNNTAKIFQVPDVPEKLPFKGPVSRPNS